VIQTSVAECEIKRDRSSLNYPLTSTSLLIIDRISRISEATIAILLSYYLEKCLLMS